MWQSGEPWSYAPWASPEPNYCNETSLVYSAAQFPNWNNYYTLLPLACWIEWSADCNADGVVDFGQIRNGELADTNTNGVPDICEPAQTLAFGCASPGPNTYSPNSDPNTANFGLVACAIVPAFPNCATGGTLFGSYAKVIPSGAVSGAISCVNFGVFSVVRDVNPENTACVNYISDVALPATIGI
jgi:hypothetical protein